MKTFLLRAAVVVAATACGGDGPTHPVVPLTGIYTLQTVNGAPLPFTVAATLNGRVDVVGATITFAPDGTWTLVSSLRTTASGNVTTAPQTDRGAYRQAADGSATITGTLAGSPINGTASLSGNTLTVVSAGLTLAFGKG